MKQASPLTIKIFVAVALSCGLTVVSAADPETAEPADIRTFIAGPLEVPAFSPPAPAVEKQMPAMRVDARVSVPSASSHRINIVRGEASTQPDILIPLKTGSQALQLTPEEIARHAHERLHFIHLGATVCDHGISKVHWNHPETGEIYEAICGFDLGLLGGIGQFVRNGENYQLSMMISHADDGLPNVPTDSITILKGDPNDPVGTGPINCVKDLIVAEKLRLIRYQTDRLAYQKAAAEWEKAHPPIPRDETFWLRPHRGSRYLADPKPETAIK
jgi:hypothetical protein